MNMWKGIIMLLALVAASCAQPGPQTPPSQARPAVQDLTVRIKAHEQLNLYRGTAHALHLCIYQLTDPNGFNQLSESETGIGKLMSCERLDPGGVPGMALARKVIVQPGEKRTVEFDWAEGTRFVGIAAGYYQLHKRGTVRVYRIPSVQEEQKQGRVATRQRAMTIDLSLGPQGIEP